MFFCFFKQYFSINWKDFCSIDIVYTSLEINSHRYTDKDAGLLSLKKKTKNKWKKDLFHLFDIFLLTITFFYLFFFHRQLQNVSDHSLSGFSLKEMSFVCWDSPNAQKLILSTIRDLFILTHFSGAQSGKRSPKCCCYGPACVCIFPCQVFVCLSFDFCSLLL